MTEDWDFRPKQDIRVNRDFRSKRVICENLNFRPEQDIRVDRVFRSQRDVRENRSFRSKEEIRGRPDPNADPWFE